MSVVCPEATRNRHAFLVQGGHAVRSNINTPESISKPVVCPETIKDKTAWIATKMAGTKQSKHVRASFSSSSASSS